MTVQLLSIYLSHFLPLSFLAVQPIILTSAKSNVCLNLAKTDYVLSDPTLSSSIYHRNFNMKQQHVTGKNFLFFEKY